MTITRRAVGLGLAATLLQALMLIAFAWPAVNLAPRDLPIAVAGPQAAQVGQQLQQRSPDAFAITTLADADAARTALADREVYGAIVTGGGAPQVLVASAASPAVAQQLTALAQQLGGVATVPVQDVIAADPDDPRGAGFGAMVLPLVMSGIAAGILLTLVIPTLGARLAGLVTFGVVGGLLSTLVFHTWLSIVPGSYFTLAAIAALASFAVAATIVGLAATIGRAGIGLGALLMLLIGNPFSAATSAPELLPQPWGTLGQLLPPGAAATLLRSIAYFDGAGAALPLTILLTWSVAGLALLGLGALRTPRPDPIEAPEPVPA
ncbi:hypothetical protein [Nocardia caishijiensis]|uniref:ABC transporter permease n=1 Tax=Nocardia caishijiensis TaxID=184756 RepID=A0ABQ6YJF6_9NOCA|nr:hypothetical protein [Nocardia caishijiensis]KAF0845778.1 hypothetical protein FNL39_106167 [Nocardia caishijiensis]